MSKNFDTEFFIFFLISCAFHSSKFKNPTSVLPRNFLTGDNVPGLLKKWGHLRKKWGHCGGNDGPVIWRSKISLSSVYIITDHTLTVNK